MNELNKTSALGALGFLAILVALLGTVIFVSLAPTPSTTTVYTDRGVQVVTSDHSTLPKGMIIHKDFGKFWLCVEIDSNFILMRNSGPSSLAVSVDSCNVE